MINLTKEQIKEIAEQLDCGFRSFVHKENGELLFTPDTLRHPDMDLNAWSEENEKLDNNFMDYLEIEPLESRDSFQIMANFAESLTDSNKLKEKLFNALNRRGPFREFNFVIDNSGEYREEWFKFKDQKLRDWVQENIDRFNDMIKE
jgi:hypothetical protein